MSEHDSSKPVCETGVTAAEAARDCAALPEIKSPSLSPAEAVAPDGSKQETPAVAAAESEAEVIMLPAKFAAFLAASTSRFRERALALPSAGRRAATVALMVAIAAASGVGGAMLHSSDTISAAERGEQAEQVRLVRDAIARIESEFAAVRSNMDRYAKLSTASASKTGERLDRIEKAQAEPAARLAKLTDSVEKLRAAPPAAAPASTVAAAPPPLAATVAAAASPPARDVTGSISAQASAKVEAAKPVIVDGWVVRDAAKGAALIEGRNGLLEVYVGDSVPGVGRVDAVRRQDGRWVVVTGKGLIVTR